MDSEMDLPYAGLRVVDCSQGLAAPSAAALLAMYGAEVIKIETPTGDWGRGIGVNKAGNSCVSLTANMGKRSLIVDMKSAEGLALIHRLAGTADIFLESSRPGVAQRLGIDYATLSGNHPELIYLSLSGYGQTGPYRDRACSDTVAQAFAGFIASNTGVDGIPHRVNTIPADIAGGLYAFQAISVALFRRTRTGRGGYIDLSLTQAMAHFQGVKFAEYKIEDGAPSAFNEPAGNYLAADGWIVITLVKEESFAAICAALDMPELASDPRFDSFKTRGENKTALRQLIADKIAGQTVDTWLEVFGRHGVMCNKLNDYSDWLADEHVRATGAVEYFDQPGLGEVPYPAVPGGMTRPATWAPTQGAGGAAALAAFGVSESEMADLVASGAITLTGY
ncbi:MAG: CoA transferase [Pseudomonadota bacterium]|nr:CoA transferase [Pseudomonadota bacterium]